MPGPYDLQRFVDAQAPVYDHVLAELRRGQKTGHWMWFIFPQLRGLGYSAMAHRYGIASKAVAEAYLQHPTLGPRLIECARLVNQIEGCSLCDIFDSPDDMKFCSSMTLFARAAPDNETFLAALEKYCGGELDPRTLALLE
ncbi:hypothetical protein BE21_04050 [Sorangium cellulosum]|uniref:Calpastatin n=1 Tax=Sorangium cellulosum TaxID=56 RepID=A0A150TI44_SORCE|nr:hypothetical protein BE21_04050 [Sorangium cellulosum]